MEQQFTPVNHLLGGPSISASGPLCKPEQSAQSSVLHYSWVRNRKRKRSHVVPSRVQSSLVKQSVEELGVSI